MEFVNPTYLILAIFVLGMNLIPAFMPPTWIVLAFFYTQFNLSFLPTILIGASMATLGRIGLYYLSRYLIKDRLPKDIKNNYSALGDYFSKNQSLTIPVVLAYAFLPIPSNQVFLIAGLTDLNIRLIAFSFLIGRLISYSFWVAIANKVAGHLETIFSKHFSNSGAILVELLGFVLIYFIGKINWKKVLKMS